jgi:polygalacturonase
MTKNLLTIDIRDKGAVQGSDCTYAIRQALAEPGAKLVRIPEGTWHTGPLDVRSNTTLLLEKGSRLLFSDDENLYGPVFSRWEGVECYCMHPCLYIEEAENVSIIGEGTLDGNGSKWWAKAVEKKMQSGPITSIEKALASLNADYAEQPEGGGGRQSQYLRPPLLQAKSCSNLLIKSVTLVNSPFWTLHPIFCSSLRIENVRIINPYTAPNTDGIDIDSCTDVKVLGCFINVGDDGIALKSGSGKDGMRRGKPTEKVLIKDCLVLGAHGGVVIGSETAGGIHDIQAFRCTFDGTDRGIRIKTRRQRGGAIRNLEFSDIVMRDTLCPVTVNMYYGCAAKEGSPLFSLESLPVEPSTPSISDIRISNVSSTGSRSSVGFLVGLPESPITGLEIKDSSFSLATEGLSPASESEMYKGLPDPKGRGLRCRNVNARLVNVTISGMDKPIELESDAIVERK